MHDPFFSQPLPIKPNDMDISDEMRDVALKRTTKILHQLDEVRKALEFPTEHLPIVIETYGKTVAAVIAEKERADLAERTLRLPLTMRSETKDYQPMKIKKGEPFKIDVRPQFLAFRAEDLAISRNPERWVVHDILVGNRSQFARNGTNPVPGTKFGPGGVLEHLRLETCQTAMDFSIVAQYVGPEEDGEVFEAVIVGTTLRY